MTIHKAAALPMRFPRKSVVKRKNTPCTIIPMKRNAKLMVRECHHTVRVRYARIPNAASMQTDIAAASCPAPSAQLDQMKFLRVRGRVNRYSMVSPENSSPTADTPKSHASITVHKAVRKLE